MNRPHALSELPEGYGLYRRLDLIKDWKLLLNLSLASVGMFIFSGIVLMWLLQVLRPNIAMAEVGFSFQVGGGDAFLIPLLVLLGVILGMVILHEAIHGLFFWMFTRARVKFAFKGAYAYAAAPGWYIYKSPYMVVSLAPLILITAVGILASLWAPVSWLSALMLLIVLNASGAVGDIYVFILLVRMPGDVLIRDFGEQMNIFTPTGEVGTD